MRLSLIIPVKADPRLARCLDALSLQTLSVDRFEILVVDNAGREDTRRIAERGSARYIAHADGGSYAARQRGAEEARGEILVFTDADCEPPADWLATIDRLFEDPACMVVTGPSSSADEVPVSSWVQAIDEQRWQALLAMDRVAFCDTRNLALRREVLAAVPFDPSFRQAGDIDLGIRLFERGIPIRLEPALRLVHEHPRSLAAVLRRAFRRGRGLARLDRKHGQRARPIGQRPFRIAGWDAKAAVLRWSGRRGFRWVAIPLISVALLPIMALLAVLSVPFRAPSGPAPGVRLFVVFERLSLLLGRLAG
jgi:glycosyltransferase involved in cell wall biosynthesis